MDIMQMFRGGQQSAAPTPAVNPQPQTPSSNGNPNPQPGPGDRSGINPDPNAGKIGQDGKPVEKSPLADFADFWKNDTPKDGEQPPTNWDDPSSVLPKLNLDPKKIYESAQRIDYSKVMPREKVEAALKGDSQAFSDVINSVAHHAYANMAMASARMTEAMMKQLAPKMFEALPHHIRKHVVNDTIDSTDPIFQNPAVAPMLESVKEQMRIKYPKAPAPEIAKMAQRYVKEFAQAVSGKESTPNSKNTPSKPGVKTGQGDESWDDFLEIAPPQ